MTAHRRILFAVFVLAVSARLFYANSTRGTALDRLHEWDQSDMATYVEQSRRLADGDWLGRDPYRPIHLWQSFAPPEAWERWSRPFAFHQAPGYAYFLAACRVVAGERWIGLAKLLQLIAGAATAVLVADLARKLGGRVAAIAAGALAATYGPAIVVEAQLLREGPSILIFAVALAFAARARERVGMAAAAGFAFGALALFHESAQVVAAGTLAAIVLPALRSPRFLAFAAPRAALFVAAAVAGFSPWIARNLAVGAPPTLVSTRAPIVFAMSNVADAPMGGAEWGAIGASLPAVLEAGGGAFGPTARAALATYRDRPAKLPLDWATKALASIAPGEAPDNFSYAFVLDRVPWLRAAPSFAWVFAPAVAGAVAAFRSPRRRRGAGTIAAAPFVLLALAFTVVHTTGRWRLLPLPAVLPLAGFAVARFVALRRIARRRPVAARRLRGDRAVPAALASALAAQALALAVFGFHPPRSGDFVVAGNLEHAAGNFRAAEEAYRRAIELGEIRDSVKALLDDSARRAALEGPQG